MVINIALTTLKASEPEAGLSFLCAPFEAPKLLAMLPF